jgi:hypothetical protein
MKTSRPCFAAVSFLATNIRERRLNKNNPGGLETHDLFISNQGGLLRVLVASSLEWFLELSGFSTSRLLIKSVQQDHRVDNIVFISAAADHEHHPAMLSQYAFSRVSILKGHHT